MFARPQDQNRTLATATALSMAGMTAAFGWILLMDVRLYGALPDARLLPLQLLLAATTVIAATRRRWAPTMAAVVATGVGVGSALQPITVLRLTSPEALGMQVGTGLLLLFAGAAALTGVTATARTVRAARRLSDEPARRALSVTAASSTHVTSPGDGAACTDAHRAGRDAHEGSRRRPAPRPKTSR